jgi:hypothetical protein
VVVDELLSRAISGESLAVLIASFVHDRGVDFDTTVDSVALELGRRFLAGEMPYELADDLANQMWAAMMKKSPDFSELTFSDIAFAIYEAFDAGEYCHPPEKDDPVEAFTIPMLRTILGQDM